MDFLRTPKDEYAFNYNLMQTYTVNWGQEQEKGRLKEQNLFKVC